MEAITSLDQLNLNQVYTYADYLTWQFEDRVELIKGMIFKMAAPNKAHQIILSNLHLMIGSHFLKKSCFVGLSPFDVGLPKAKGKKAYTVVQPDLFVICDPAYLDDAGCDGVPDFIIEIVSPSTQKIDTKIKYDLYAEMGVREYWIVYPLDKLVHQFVLLENGIYKLENAYSQEDTITPVLFPELEIPLDDIFPTDEPKK